MEDNNSGTERRIARDNRSRRKRADVLKKKKIIKKKNGEKNQDERYAP